MVNAAMEHVRMCLQLWLWPWGASYVLRRLHLELAAIKTLGISRGPHVSFQPLEARLQAGATPCNESEITQSRAGDIPVARL